MMVPYHSSQFTFQILQLDVELEMQGKLVVCNSVEATMKEKRKGT